MKILSLVFFFFLTYNYRKVLSYENNFVNNSNFLVLNKIKITSSYFTRNKREEKDLLTKTIDGNENENSYILINEKINSYNLININCTFKIKKEFDKTKLTIFLIKKLMDNHKENKNSYDIKELKTNETFIFTNEFKNHLVISNLSILVVNLIAFNGYYNFDILITDGKYSLKIPFFRVFLFFYNNLPITAYPIKKENMIIMSFMKKHLTRNYKKKYVNNVVYNYRDYYSLPLIQENNNFEKHEQMNTKIIIFIIFLMAYLFIVYIYLIFIYLKYNIKNVHTNYYNYVFIFSFMLIMFLFILYDFFLNIIQISYIFIFSFTFFLVVFYKTLTNLREIRK
ncbi:conserved Plasmodium protein, unknown function [Plasmodium gallinaceum]|uniref:Dolichyl-diphosphooligosaccharide--protein glycosyltransferase subunit 2 n=1 Tax=Plasmodium gallinaceum TaxID=5849 RepID=A0A1J1GKW9_PLAGA|nr:conserved Plasmodium protein, unknown function [Plasmodium gallinaceum]CRG93030.1 conserved Plasmodium protein, unknown function [Plasmodium gallinaceum]